jgi:hypothetical protein
MDKEFQTTFIPKRSVSSDNGSSSNPAPSAGSQGFSSASMAPAQASRPISLVGILALIIFIAVVVSAGGVIFFEKSLRGNIVVLQDQLDQARKVFEPEFLTELRRLDMRLSVSQMLLNQHVVLTPIFDILEQTILPDVRYSRFSYTISDGQVFVSAEGIARSFTAIAQQSNVLGRHVSVRNHIFSDFQTDEMGNVGFRLALAFLPDVLLYNSQARTSQASM